MGRAVVFGQRREVGSRPAAVSAPSGRESAVASACSFASTPTTATSCAGRRWWTSFDCYVIEFEPVGSGTALYRGTVWIDRATFARVRVQTVQSGLPAPVVSNDETQHYTPVATIGGRPVFLFTRMSARQILMVAGRNVLVEKSVAFTNVQVNQRDFAAARDAARASNRVMYKETDQGLRHYVKEGEVRVVSNRPSSSVKAMAMGVTIDPSYGFPLPIFGINYLDFEFGSPDTQLALLFGGVLAAGNIQRPKLGSTPLDASVDFFAIAAPSSDRLYGPEGEREDQRVLTWPLSSGVNLGWQYTAFQKAQFQYQFRFDAYVRDRTTAESFVLAAEHDHERLRRRLGVPSRRIQLRRQRNVVPPALGRAAHLHEIHREHLARLVLQGDSQDSSERRVVRRAAPRPVLEVSVRHVRRHAHPRRARVRRSIPGADDGPRIVLVQSAGPVPPRPLSRAGVGARSGCGARVAAGHRPRRRRELARADGI